MNSIVGKLKKNYLGLAFFQVILPTELLLLIMLEFLPGQAKSRGNISVTLPDSKGSSFLSSATHFQVFALFTAPSALCSSWFSSGLELVQ